MSLAPGSGNLDWLVADFSERVPGVRQAVVVSSDGLLLAMSDGLDRAEGDRFAAIAAGLMGLAKGTAGSTDGGAVQSVCIEMQNAFVLVTSISEGGRFAVVAERPADIGLLAYEMALFSERAGAVLTPELVAELQAALPR